LHHHISDTRKFRVLILVLAMGEQANISPSQVREDYPSRNGD
jgi:hypothetical protein